MTESEITERFLQAVKDSDAMKGIGVTKYQLYKYRNPDKQRTGVGTMLEVLWKLDLIQFKK